MRTNEVADSRSTHTAIGTDYARMTRLSPLVMLFLISLLLPFIIQIGGLRLSVYRAVLVVASLPLLVIWIRGGAGRIRVADIVVLCLCFWCTLSFLAVHGVATAVEAGGIFFVETAGSYLLGRCLVRTADHFHHVVKLLFAMVVFLMPFAMFEALTGRDLLLETMDRIWPTYNRIVKEPRWGLQRVQATFEHPILFGMFCGSVIGPVYMVLGYGQSFVRRASKAFLVFLTAALSLSSGPLTGMIVQFLLIAWNGLLVSVRARWKIMAVLVALLYAIIEIGSNRSAAAVFISYFSFNQYSAYMRLHIWGFGTASILQHPLLGIGLNEWARPEWMSPSIDMFWIVYGVRHGIPAMVFTFLTFFTVYISLALKKKLDSRCSDYRLGALFSLTAFFLTGWTVHFWSGTYVLFMFLLGASVWLLDAQPDNMEAAPYISKEPISDAKRIRYSRFQHRHARRFRH